MYKRQVLQLEAMPPDGNSSVIDASWRIAHRYKRPDFLVREVMGDVLFQNLPDYAVESIVFEDESPVFSSNGRPFYEENGAVRWLKRNTVDKSIWMAHQNSLVKYDETLDTYTKVATTPDDTSITALPPLGYGTERQSARIRLPAQLSTDPVRYWSSFEFIQVISGQLYVIEKTLFETRRIFGTGSGGTGIAVMYTLSRFSTDAIAERSGIQYYLSGNIRENVYNRQTNVDPWEAGEQSYYRRRIQVHGFWVAGSDIYIPERVYTCLLYTSPSPRD